MSQTHSEFSFVLLHFTTENAFLLPSLVKSSKYCEIQGSHSSVAEDPVVLRCDTVSLGV